MAGFLLSVHVVAAVVFVGSVTVAVSLFPRYARLALEVETAGPALPAVHLLHRITRVYAVLALAVPVFGIAVGSALGVLGEPWVLVSMGLTLVAGLLLGGVVLPGQRRLLELAEGGPVPASAAAALVAPPAPRADPATLVRRLGMASGTFNLVWVVVVVLMILRPGSTTGV